MDAETDSSKRGSRKSRGTASLKASAATALYTVSIKIDLPMCGRTSLSVDHRTLQHNRRSPSVCGPIRRVGESEGRRTLEGGSQRWGLGGVAERKDRAAAAAGVNGTRSPTKNAGRMPSRRERLCSIHAEQAARRTQSQWPRSLSRTRPAVGEMRSFETCWCEYSNYCSRQFPIRQILVVARDGRWRRGSATNTAIFQPGSAFRIFPAKVESVDAEGFDGG